MRRTHVNSDARRVVHDDRLGARRAELVELIRAAPPVEGVQVGALQVKAAGQVYRLAHLHHGRHLHLHDPDARRPWGGRGREGVIDGHSEPLLCRR